MTNGENQLHIAFSPRRTAQRASITHQERAVFPPFLTIYEQKIKGTNKTTGADYSSGKGRFPTNSHYLRAKN